MKLILNLVLCLAISVKVYGQRGDCIPEQSLCKNAAANCCDPNLWACRWTEEQGYRCYERYPLFDQTLAFKACIPIKDRCVKDTNYKCCNDGRCKLGHNGWYCVDRGTYPGPLGRKAVRNCTKKGTHHNS